MSRLLELFKGTGSVGEAYKTLYPEAEIISLDINPATQMAKHPYSSTQTWGHRRDAFIRKRHLAQYKTNPTERRKLALICGHMILNIILLFLSYYINIIHSITQYYTVPFCCSQLGTASAAKKNHPTTSLPPPTTTANPVCEVQQGL